MKISAVIITFNEAKNIRRCLESLKWADEIVVVDSGSSDDTVSIAREYTGRVHYNKWPGHKEQKNYAVSLAGGDWVLSVDADEECTDELRAEIMGAVGKGGFDGFMFPRRNIFMGKWLRYGGWYPDHVLRLFRPAAGRFEGVNPHDKVNIYSGRAGRLETPIIHYAYNSIAQFIEKQNSYSSITASHMTGKSHPVLIVMKLFSKFTETYFLKKGFMDGFYGLFIAIIASFFCFIKYLKVYLGDEKRL